MTQGSYPEYLSPRCSGILLHITSLPGPYGVGELGPTAQKWLELLAECGQHLWQILPIHPLGYGASPYQSTSAMAFNPLLISLEALLDEGLLEKKDFKDYPHSEPGRVAYERIRFFRRRLLKKAAERFLSTASRLEYDTFCEKNDFWLDDYVLFAVLSERFANQSWLDWPEEFKHRNPEALQLFREEFAQELAVHRVWQFFFHQQWEEIRKKARALKIKIIGDMPIFVAHDSADVWAHPELFDLNSDGSARVVAGVPPDYFSETGQRWGNPLYRWDIHKQDEYAWWRNRFKIAFSLFDVIRIDHFRGFVDYWEIPANEATAVRGRWVKGPADDFFQKVREHLGELPLIAEDLGIIGADVHAFRDRLGIPGLRILDFAFEEDNAGSPFLPQNYIENSVAYTGTHDNNTLLGVFHPEPDEPEAERADFRRQMIQRQMPSSFHEAPLTFSQKMLLWLAASKSQWVIIPMQDVLELGSVARMNTPNTTHGNWEWKLDDFNIPATTKEFMKIVGRR